MLVRFTLENFLSFREEAILSLEKSRVQSHPGHVVKAKSAKNASVLKTALIYGANASGKSNLIKAMSVAQRLVTDGQRSGQAIPTYAYKLDLSSYKSPTSFTFEIKVGDNYYEYGFAIGSGKVVKEWLKTVTKRTENIIFNRKFTENGYVYTNDTLNFSDKNDVQFFEFTQKGTPENRLFLNECKERNIEQNLPGLIAITETIDWFEHTLSIVFPDTKYGGLEFNLHSNSDFSVPFEKILKKFDTGINALDLKKIDLKTGIAGVPNKILEEISESIEESEHVILAVPGNKRYMFRKDKDKETEAHKLITKHLDSNGDRISFDLTEESDGTQRLLDIIPGFIGIMLYEKVFIIDELDRSLHPDITRTFFSSFLSATKGKGSQLIVTTHDAGLMDSELIRKDEIWFTQKDSKGESELYSLDEYQKIRKDTDIYRGYKIGRYGGVPILSPIKIEDIGLNGVAAEQ